MHRHYFQDHCAIAGVCRLSGLEAAHAHPTRLAAEAQRAQAEIAAAEVEIGKVKIEILRGLNAQRRQERREAYRRLLSAVRLRSERKPRGRMVTRRTAEIIPRPEAGIEGLPKSVAFGKEGMTIGYSPSGTDGRSAGAAGCSSARDQSFVLELFLHQ